MKKNINRVKSALRRCGVSWQDLSSRAQAIILFGSRATSFYSRDSDVDLLCLGTGRRISSDGVHLVWISLHRFKSNDWRTSELGGHVARYGVLLHGKAPIGTARPAGPTAIKRKLMKIRERADVLDENWRSLSSQFRRAEIRKLRRDIQRLAILEAGGAVPPTPMLDRQWAHVRQKRQYLFQLLRSHKTLRPLVVRLVSRGVRHS